MKPIRITAPMYACICNRLTEEEVREVALASGERCPEVIYAKLGKKPDCRCCLARSEAFIDQVLKRPHERVSLREVKTSLTDTAVA